MVTIDNTDIKVTHDPNNKKLIYHVDSFDNELLQLREKRAPYYSKVIDTITKDAEKRGGLEFLSFSAPDESYIQHFQKRVNAMISESKKQLRKDEYLSKEMILKGTPIAAAGLLGAIEGGRISYEIGLEITNSQDTILPMLDSIIAGGITGIGTLAFTGACSFSAYHITNTFTNMYRLFQHPKIEKNIRRYKAMQKALEKTS